MAGRAGLQVAERVVELAAGQAAEQAGGPRRDAGGDDDHAVQGLCPLDPSFGGTDVVAQASP